MLRLCLLLLRMFSQAPLIKLIAAPTRLARYFNHANYVPKIDVNCRDALCKLHPNLCKNRSIVCPVTCTWNVSAVQGNSCDNQSANKRLL